MKEAIARIAEGQSFSSAEMEMVIAEMMSGEATAAQMGGFLIGMRVKGVESAELAGAARAMRGRALRVNCPNEERAVDTCGTGGDGARTVNISTLAAIISAAAGAVVPKHGNRALSSLSGSADVLEALGVNIEAAPGVVQRCLDSVGIAFLFAPLHHSATRHVAGPRRELGTRTLFNLLGPLTNPAGVKNQVVGVFAAEWCEPVAQALAQLGANSVYVVHGAGGLDEVSVAGKTRVCQWTRDRQTLKTFDVAPSDFGLDEENPDELAGGDAQHNAAVLRGVLDGQRGAVRTAALLQASLALNCIGLVEGLRPGVEAAAATLDDGRARRKLEEWVACSNT